MKKLFMTSFFALILTLAACGGDSGEEDPATNEDTGTPTEQDSGEDTGSTDTGSTGTEGDSDMGSEDSSSDTGAGTDSDMESEGAESDAGSGDADGDDLDSDVKNDG
ncbi:hypothetical protein ACFFJI_04525 [Allobacillus sp. GCM10007491]|uniref:Uncharacterized protein n=1 Tax=Allobacillus saliphilus TaxID=2912308 RepID=A0A941HTV2_9BACI|nr:hypothetical protein [Allobacillus saliphilus]MBR7554783.1 hypothetical protein [Allobacillus saliphilus]